MEEIYKIRATLLGHSSDVRGVSVGTTEGGKSFIVSGSRDKKSIVWMSNELGLFDPFQTNTGHTNFVSCVKVIQPSAKYPKGLILTGSNDHTILAFELGLEAPVFRLVGHKNTVCALAAIDSETFVSSSWDTTVRVWKDQTNTLTLTGHEQAVWDVSVVPGTQAILTGSADKTIKLWEGEKATKTFSGHIDCVRAVVAVNADMFLSASNDATVRVWSISEGTCLQVLYGHTNFIYRLALIPDGSGFVSVGEDRSLRVWKKNECVQVIFHPATSVWCVDVMPDGDVVTGSSDGNVRVFTKSPDRYAPVDIQALFDEEVSATAVAMSEELGGQKLSEYPGPEALQVEGKSDGATKVIREGAKAALYSWSAAEHQWKKVGDVVGASGGTQLTSGKVLHDGQEYDYVFDVEVDSERKLKLPYNLNEDAWFAAKRFIDKNDLTPECLDQVANHIITMTKGKQNTVAPDANFADPFTGTNRYVPGASSDVQQMGGGLDPFTGSGAYRSQAARAVDAVSTGPSFPVTEFVVFQQQPNISAVKTKLTEFIKEMGVSNTITPEMIAYFVENVAVGSYCEELQVLVQNLLELPTERVFPVLDLLRVGVIESSFAFQLNAVIPIVDTIVPKYVASAHPVNQQLALKLLNNLFRSLIPVMVENRPVIIAKLLENIQKPKNNQIATATLFLNYSIAATSKDHPEWSSRETKDELLMATMNISEVIDEPEAVYRVLVAIGNLIYKDPDSITMFKSLSGEALIQRHKNSGLAKVHACAAEIVGAVHF